MTKTGTVKRRGVPYMVPAENETSIQLIDLQLVRQVYVSCGTPELFEDWLVRVAPTKCINGNEPDPTVEAPEMDVLSHG